MNYIQHITGVIDMALDPVEYDTHRYLLKIDEEVRRRDEADKRSGKVPRKLIKVRAAR